MRWCMVPVFVLAVACSNKPSPPKNEFEAFERAFVHQNEVLAKAMRRNGEKVADKDIPTSYRAVFIGPSGVFVDSKLVATLAEIDTRRADIVAAIEANAKLLPTVGWRPSMTFDLDAEPAAVAISALRLFAGRDTSFNVRRQDEEIPEIASQPLCTVNIRTQPAADREVVVELTLFLEAGRTWVGLSRLNEFQELPDRPDGLDIEKLSTTLREHKMGPFFADRTDLELGAAGGKSGHVIRAFYAACNAGFIDIAVLDKAQLSAVPSL